VEEADKLALRALSEWDAGDEKKAVKYADKASRKADRSFKSAIETERALANIMAGLKEVFASTISCIALGILKLHITEILVRMHDLNESASRFFEVLCSFCCLFVYREERLYTLPSPTFRLGL